MDQVHYIGEGNEKNRLSERLVKKCGHSWHLSLIGEIRCILWKGWSQNSISLLRVPQLSLYEHCKHENRLLDSRFRHLLCGNEVAYRTQAYIWPSVAFLCRKRINLPSDPLSTYCWSIFTNQQPLKALRTEKSHMNSVRKWTVIELNCVNLLTHHTTYHHFLV